MSDKNEDAKTCSSFGPALHKTVAVAIDLVGSTAQDSPDTIKKILRDKKVQKKVAEELKKVGQAMMKEQNGGQPISFGTSFGRLGTAAIKSLQDPAISEVKKSPDFKRLQNSLSQTKCAFENSPVGVFVNENKTLLIIVGSVAAIGGGVAMYQTKAGDPVANFAAGRLAGLSIYKIGAVKFSLKKVEFKPSIQKIGADVKAAGKWKNVKADFELGATFTDESLSRLAGRGNLILTIGKNWQGTAVGTYNWSRDDAKVTQSITGKTAIDYKTKLTRDTSLGLQLFGNFSDNNKGLSQQVGLNANVLTATDLLGDDSKVTFGASVSRRVSQARNNRGYAPSVTDDRIMLNLKFKLP